MGVYIHAPKIRLFFPSGKTPGFLPRGCPLTPLFLAETNNKSSSEKCPNNGEI